METGDSPIIGLKETIFPIACPKVIVECGGGDVPDKGEHQLSEGRRWQQLSFPLEIILSFGLSQDSSDHKDPKQTHQNDPHPLREPFKEITSQSYRKDCFVKIQEESRNSLTPTFTNERFPHKLSILYSVYTSKDFGVGGDVAQARNDAELESSPGNMEYGVKS